MVQDAQSLEEFVRRSLDEPQFGADLGERAHRLVRSQLGATQRSTSLLEMLVESTPAHRRNVAA
jgi:hypothetical protein